MIDEYRDIIESALRDEFSSDPVEHGDEGGGSPYIDINTGTTNRTPTQNTPFVVAYWYAETDKLVIATVAEVDDTGETIDDGDEEVFRIVI